MLAAHVPVPRTVDPSRIVTVAPVSHVMSKVGVALFVKLSVLDVPESEPACKSGIPGVAGAEVSIVTAKLELAALSFPAESVWVAVIV